MNKLLAAALLSSSVCGFSNSLNADTVIDDFTNGGVTISNRNGQSTLDYSEDPSILGGARELQTRDAWSGSLGGQSNVTVDVSGGGSVSFYGGGNWGNRTACDNSAAYGTAIGTIGQRNGQNFPINSPNFGRGAELNLELTLDTEILVDIAQLGYGGTAGHLNIQLLSGGTGGLLRFQYQEHFTSTGVIAIPLSAFASRYGDILTPALAADIDGISVQNGACSSGGISDGLVVNSLALGGGDSDADGVPDADDVCPNTQLGAAVLIGGIDSGIANGFNPTNGCSTADLVNEVVEDCSLGARNHGQFVSCSAKGANSLKSSGIISGKDKGALQRAAAQSDIP
jgi:hypothetical protein